VALALALVPLQLYLCFFLLLVWLPMDLVSVTVLCSDKEKGRKAFNFSRTQNFAEFLRKAEKKLGLAEHTAKKAFLHDTRGEIDSSEDLPYNQVIFIAQEGETGPGM
jgi:hypothetical protein